MKLIIIFVSIIHTYNAFCKETGYQNASPETKQELSTSSFIKFIEAKTNGEIPYPFEKLVKSFGIDINDSSPIMIPLGRSLAKDHANFRNPRIVVNPVTFNSNNFDLKSEDLVGPNEVFLGFAPEQNSIEVIS